MAAVKKTSDDSLWGKIGDAEASGYKEELAAYTHEWLRQQALTNASQHRNTTVSLLESWIQRATGNASYKRPVMTELREQSPQFGKKQATPENAQ